MTPDQLLAFEADIAAEFEAGNIKAPVHLAGGNERAMISAFTHAIKKGDWVLCDWRSHYACLLHGVPPEKLKQAIMDGRSIALCFPEYKIISSAIVGGTCPWAVGLGWAIKERKGAETVHVFIGDMTATTGIHKECLAYCEGHDLPVKFWIHDNNKSVCTDTKDVWGALKDGPRAAPRVSRYLYEMTRPHVGIGKFVRF